MGERCDKTLDIFGALMTPDQLKSVLKEKGWTQKAAAEYLGIDKDWFGKIINNHNGERKRLHDCDICGLPSL